MPDLTIHMPCGCPYPKLGDHRPCEHGYPGVDDACPESKMGDGSHATDYEDSGSCPWCGERNPGWREVPGE